MLHNVYAGCFKTSHNNLFYHTNCISESSKCSSFHGLKMFYAQKSFSFQYACQYISKFISYVWSYLANLEI